nr:MAG TPA: Receptor Binding Protein [Caudoviricetes sp.]
MAEKSGFFNARETEDGTYDREYDAEQFAEYFANFISDGVYANPANQLKVVFDDSPSKPFVVIVRKGKAYIDGYWYELTEDMEITIPVSTKPYAIKDVVCCTLDKTERKVSIVLKEDVTSDYPANNNTQHDLVLSTILVQPNASKLNAEDITDKRPDKTYCGFVTGMVDQIDTTELFKQYDDAFQNWFNEMKDQLSTDAAGNLQTQIGLLSNLKTTVKDSVVNAINSLYDSIIGKTLKTLDEVKSNTEQGYYVDALAVAELNDKTGEIIENQDDFQVYTLFGGKIKVVSGSTVISGTGKNYVALFSIERLKSLFGESFSTTRLSVTTYNGDDATQPVQFYEPENWNGTIYQYFSATVSGNIRINYRMEYVYK